MRGGGEADIGGDEIGDHWWSQNTVIIILNASTLIKPPPTKNFKPKL